MQYVKPEIIERIIIIFNIIVVVSAHFKFLWNFVRFKGSPPIYTQIYEQNILYTHTNTAVLSWWQIFSTHRCWRMALNTHSEPCLQRLRNNNKFTRIRKETQMSVQWSVEGHRRLQTLWNPINGKGITHYTLWQWHIHCVHKKMDFRRNAIYISIHFPSLSLNCAHNV